MRFSICMSSPRGFTRLLKELAKDSPDPVLLEDPDWEESTFLAGFSSREWAQSRNPGDDRRAAFVLLVAYHTRLLIEQVRFGYKPYLRLGAVLFLAQHVWPAYEVWVGGSAPLPGDRSLSVRLSWLRAPGRLVFALRELGVSDPEAPELRVREQDLDHDRSTLYGWVSQARGAVYREILKELDPEGGWLREPVSGEALAFHIMMSETPESELNELLQRPDPKSDAILDQPSPGDSSTSPMGSSPKTP